nr:MAG TPA: hypothetical protein [Caudoviricetes sp.]
MLVAHTIKNSDDGDFLEVVYDADMVMFASYKDNEGNVTMRTISAYKFMQGKMVKVNNEKACAISPGDKVSISSSKIEYDM